MCLLLTPLLQIGDIGFYCVDCPKLFPRVPTSTPSPAPGQKRRRRSGYLTEADVRRFLAKRAKRSLGVREKQDKSQLRQVRGSWYAPKEAGQLPLARIYSHSHTDRSYPVRKRQSTTFGSEFDGSAGVDTEDLANTPGVDFSSLQFFPDQNSFGASGGATGASNVVQNGVDWINLHAETANT